MQSVACLFIWFTNIDITFILTIMIGVTAKAGCVLPNNSTYLLISYWAIDTFINPAKLMLAALQNVLAWLHSLDLLNTPAPKNRIDFIQKFQALIVFNSNGMENKAGAL
jgi:hypothetical protein